MMDKGAVLEIIFGRWRSQIAYAGVKLGVFDALGREGKDAALIAKELTLDPQDESRLWARRHTLPSFSTST